MWYDSVMNTLPEHISYSSLSTWLECGWKYKLSKIDKIEEPHAVWFTGGSALHKATELYDLGHTGTSEEIWNEAWFAQVSEDESLNGDMNTWQYAKREDMSWWYGEGLWMLDRWVKFRQHWTPYKDYIEKEIEVPVGGTILRGAIDRVMVDPEGKIVLLDIKTGASAQRHPLQLATYAWALEKEGVVIERAGFWESRTGHVSLWNLDHIKSAKVDEIYSTFDRARKADIFVPNLSNCGRCGMLSHCKFMNGKHTRKENEDGTNAISSK